MMRSSRRARRGQTSDGVGPAGPTPSPTTETNETAQVVGDALGLSRNTYKRAK